MFIMALRFFFTETVVCVSSKFNLVSLVKLNFDKTLLRNLRRSEHIAY